MSETIFAARIMVVQGCITKQAVDCVVNAANCTLLGGSGVDRAIHLAAGVKLVEACARLGGCDVGECKITEGYNLPAKWVIHAVGPMYSQYTPKEAERILKLTYSNCLDMASANGIWTIAFPAISTGAFGYPYVEGVRAAVEAIYQWQRDHHRMSTVLVAHNSYDYSVMSKEVARHD